MDRLTFADLASPDRDPTPDETRRLTDIAREEVAPGGLTTRLGRSVAADDPGPIVSCDSTGTWRAGRYVGEMYWDGLAIEIRPRLGIETIKHWAGAALNVRITPHSGDHVGSSALIAEFLAAIWRAELVNAARHGLPGLRAPRTHVSEVARGRLDVAHTLRLRASGRPQVASVNRPKNIANPIARTIVVADRTLDGLMRRSDWRGDRVEEIMPRLRAAVGFRPKLPARRELSQVRYTPIAMPYKRVAELSHQIAKHQGLRSRATGNSADGLLIDVAELWELFLLHCARRAFGAANVTHGTALDAGHPLLRSQHYPHSGLGRLYPDIVVGPVERPVAIIDAKYKPLADPRGVDREDLYQLNAYLTAHSTGTPPLGALAYVRFPEQTTDAYAETRGPWRTELGHQVVFTRMPITEAECVEALRALVADKARL
ncbi:5-methylcytosine restriction system specificity protein McrC [Gordonia sp. 852002-51296_SCH5728562-b]|uniref:5-methylcytosine restriction system specificity protein McrC n=1 Tax=Gordonia sp. 852002-51296_SCH5728562-b TaxID=1834101 RepID=UPI0007E9509D|nr:hypothetical protein [Gordonia sp. 852002-51296_SCH5728562-b]OBA43999.1 hypothetical protein A5766_00165 [Gordonia sp. 852002-51296_SCH5728562-b]